MIEINVYNGLHGRRSASAAVVVADNAMVEPRCVIARSWPEAVIFIIFFSILGPRGDLQFTTLNAVIRILLLTVCGAARENFTVGLTQGHKHPLGTRTGVILFRFRTNRLCEKHYYYYNNAISHYARLRPRSAGFNNNIITPLSANHTHDARTTRVYGNCYSTATPLTHSMCRVS